MGEFVTDAEDLEVAEEIERLKADLARCREALEAIANVEATWTYPATVFRWRVVVRQIVLTARAALASLSTEKESRDG